MRKLYITLFTLLAFVGFGLGIYYVLPNIFGSVVYHIPKELEGYVRETSDEFGLNPCFLAGLFHHESHWKANATSYVGARGIGQIMPTTWRSVVRLKGYPYTLSDITNPQLNIRVSGAIMRYNIDNYGTLRNALVAYNAGGGRVPLPDSRLPRETQKYIRVVPAIMEGYKAVYKDLCAGDLVRGGGGQRRANSAPVNRAPESFQQFPAQVEAPPSSLENFWREFLSI